MAKSTKRIPKSTNRKTVLERNRRIQANLEVLNRLKNQ
jgi:hypothetical protein